MVYDQRIKFLEMTLEEKRLLYKIREYAPLIHIETWEDYYDREKSRLRAEFIDSLKERETEFDFYPVDRHLNRKVSLWNGQITHLEIDAIVNVTDGSLMKSDPGNPGNHDMIHEAAGPSLLEECRLLQGCKFGEAKLTGGYMLPARYVIHTAKPYDDRFADQLDAVYKCCLNCFLKENLKSIAFPAIFVEGLSPEDSVSVALKAIREFLEFNQKRVHRVIFTLNINEIALYECMMQYYFPFDR